MSEEFDDEFKFSEEHLESAKEQMKKHMKSDSKTQRDVATLFLLTLEYQLDIPDYMSAEEFISKCLNIPIDAVESVFTEWRMERVKEAKTKGYRS